MKVVHIFAENVQLFVDYLAGTDIVPNASKDIKMMKSTISRYNARDVGGFIAFQTPVRRSTLEWVKQIDDFFELAPKPIIFISDQASALVSSGVLKTKNCPLYTVDSLDNSIGDIELNRVFTTIVLSSTEIYDLSFADRQKEKITKQPREWSVLEPSDSLRELLEQEGSYASRV